MKRILITAIGSMSTECVIRQLRKQDVFIVGCDIYPAEWHYESMLCDVVYKAPLAKNEDEEYALYRLVDVYKYARIGSKRIWQLRDKLECKENWREETVVRVHNDGMNGAIIGVYK